MVDDATVLNEVCNLQTHESRGTYSILYQKMKLTMNPSKSALALLLGLSSLPGLAADVDFRATHSSFDTFYGDTH